MSRSLTIFAATDLTADRVDAAPGIKPPASDEVYLLEAIVSGKQLISWSRDRSDLIELVRRRGYDNHQITKLGPANRIRREKGDSHQIWRIQEKEKETVTSSPRLG